MTYDNGYKLTGTFVNGSREGPFRCVDDDGDESEVCFENDKYTEKKKTCPTPTWSRLNYHGELIYKPLEVSGKKSKECRNLCEDGNKSEKKKYCNRNSPPYPAGAEKCRGKTMRGNDNMWYESRPSGWKKVSSPPSKKKKLQTKQERLDDMKQKLHREEKALKERQLDMDHMMPDFMSVTTPAKRELEIEEMKKKIKDLEEELNKEETKKTELENKRREKLAADAKRREEERIAYEIDSAGDLAKKYGYY